MAISFAKYKLKELKGDAIVQLIAIDIVYSDMQKASRSSIVNMVTVLTCNELFATVAESLKLVAHPADIYRDSEIKVSGYNKSYANAFEVLLCDIYEKHGYEVTKKFFKLQVIEKHQIKISILTMRLNEIQKLRNAKKEKYLLQKSKK